MVDVSLAYTELQQRLGSVLCGLADARADTPVAACPGWSVRDVVAHHCGAVVDVVTGNMPERRAPRSPWLSLALLGYGFSLDRRIRMLGLQPLVLAHDTKARRLGGEGEPGATVRATRLDLVRALASRRTADEILGYEWSGDPEPYVAILPEYGPLQISLGE